MLLIKSVAILHFLHFLRTLACAWSESFQNKFSDMADLVKLLLAPCCSCMQSPVVREDMSYVFCTKEKLDRLESAMKDLMAKKHDIERELNLAQNKGKQPASQLQLQRWFSKVKLNSIHEFSFLIFYSVFKCTF